MAGVRGTAVEPSGRYSIERLLAGVSRTGFQAADLDVAFVPQTLLAAWR